MSLSLWIYPTALLVAGTGLLPARAVTLKYRIEQQVQQEVDLSGMGAGKQSNATSITSYFSITLEEGKGPKGAKAMHVVVDSLKVTGVPPSLQASLDSAKGMSLDGTISAGNKVEGLKASREGAAGIQFKAIMEDFFPRAKPGVKTGDSWTDTLEVRNSIGGTGSIVTRTVTNYKAGAREPKDGVPALKIEAASSSALSGTQETPQGPAAIDGSGSGSGSYYLSPDGRYLGGSRKETRSLSVTGAFAPAPIPITINQTVTITALK